MIYANELFESLEWIGPVLKLYDLAIFIRHDDVVHYQKQKYAACGGDAVPTCEKDVNPCELVKYQSLDKTTTEGGDA